MKKETTKNYEMEAEIKSNEAAYLYEDDFDEYAEENEAYFKNADTIL